MTVLGQSTSAAIVVGPIVNISGSVMVGLAVANTAIALVKYASVSGARAATTSALSVGPGLYRIVLNTVDTDTLGEMVVWVSGSAALPFVKYIDIWQAPTYSLYFGSADGIATSANVSVIVSGVLNSYNVASAGEVASAGINSAGISAIIQTALTNYDVPTSADISAIVTVVMQNVLTSYDAPTSADVSAIVNTAMINYDVPTSADISAIVTVVMQNVLTSYDVPTSSDISVLVDSGAHRYWTLASASVSGTPSSTVFHTNLVGTIDNQYNDVILRFVTGNLAGQSRVISAYTSTNRQVTVDEPFFSAPAADDGFILIKGHTHSITVLADAVSVAVSGVLASYNVASAGEVASAGINSAGISAIVQTALVNYDVPTSADVSTIVADLGGLTSAAVSGIVAGALVDYDVATSADVSVIVANLGGLTSAAVSGIVAGALTDYDVASSTDVSVIVSGVLASYNVASAGEVASAGINSAGISAIVQTALVNYDVPTSADISAIVTVVMQNVLTSYDVPTSADVSAIVSAVVSNVLTNYNVASAGDMPTSAGVSGIVIQALTDYDVPTSADISAIVPPAVWRLVGAQPAAAPQWASVNRGQMMDWMLARSLNRHSQTTSVVQIYTSAGAAIASASVGNNSTSATRDQFLG